LTWSSLDSASHSKTQAMARLVRKWRSLGIPIDGIGSQTHLKPGQGGGVKAALQTLCSAAPECAITELDVEQAGENDFVNVSKACLQVQNCVGVTVWGVRDPDSWHKQTSPLLFDAEWRPKPAYNAILKVLRDGAP
jgi:endo-1,4-beta-xylanase